ncbi:MAG: hypothetical protein V1792_01665 [Pseudomonadota bacterium]
MVESVDLEAPGHVNGSGTGRILMMTGMTGSRLELRYPPVVHKF